MNLNLKNFQPLYNQNVEFSESQKIQTDLWNYVVFPEFNDIYEKIKKPKKDSVVDEVLQRSEDSNKAGVIWNKEFEHYRFYENHIYYIELAPSLSMPTLAFKKWTVENFCKEVGRAERESEKNARKKEKISTVVAVGILILWMTLIYLIAKINS